MSSSFLPFPTLFARKRDRDPKRSPLPLQSTHSLPGTAKSAKSAKSTRPQGHSQSRTRNSSPPTAQRPRREALQHRRAEDARFGSMPREMRPEYYYDYDDGRSSAASVCVPPVAPRPQLHQRPVSHIQDSRSRGIVPPGVTNEHYRWDGELTYNQPQHQHAVRPGYSRASASAASAPSAPSASYSGHEASLHSSHTRGWGIAEEEDLDDDSEGPLDPLEVLESFYAEVPLPPWMAAVLDDGAGNGSVRERREGRERERERERDREPCPRYTESTTSTTKTPLSHPHSQPPHHPAHAAPAPPDPRSPHALRSPLTRLPLRLRRNSSIASADSISVSAHSKATQFGYMFRNKRDPPQPQPQPQQATVATGPTNASYAHGPGQAQAPAQVHGPAASGESLRTVPIHQRPLPPVPASRPSSALSNSHSQERRFTQSPIYIPEECPEREQEQERISSPKPQGHCTKVSMTGSSDLEGPPALFPEPQTRPTSVVNHIISPDERARIGPRRRDSDSSLSSAASSHRLQPPAATPSLPSSPFGSTHHLPSMSLTPPRPAGLNPPPRPRSRMNPGHNRIGSGSSGRGSTDLAPWANANERMSLL